MEEENLHSSPPDSTEPEADSWTPIEHQIINGEQQGIEWDGMEDQINEERTDKLSPKPGRDTPEEAEPWEQIIWPVHPVTCTSPRLSFATVQWDMPDPSAETPSLVTHGGFANEPDSVSVTSVGSTSPSPHPSEDINDELFTEEDREEEEGFDSELVNGNESEPCDAAEVQEATTQEEEDSTQELLGCTAETPSRTDSEEEEGEEEQGEAASSDPVETVDLIESLEEIEGSEDESDSFVDLKLEEEQEGPGVLLTTQGDLEEEQTSVEEPGVLLMTQGDLEVEQTSVEELRVLLTTQGDLEEEQTSVEEPVAVLTTQGDLEEEQTSVEELRVLLTTQGVLEEEQTSVEEPGVLLTTQGDLEEEQTSVEEPGAPLTTQGDLEEEQTSVEEPGAPLTTQGDLEEEQTSVEEPGVLLTTQGDLEEEQTSVEEPGVLLTTQGDLEEEQTSVEEPGVLLTTQGDLEEEQTSVEESGAPLTTQGDLDEEQTAVSSVEAEDKDEEGGEVEEEETVTIASSHVESEEAEADCHLSDVVVPAELRQTDDTGSTINPDKLLDLEQSELFEERERDSGTEEDIEVVERLQESPTGQTEELEMCEDVDQNMEPQQSEAADNIAEPSMQAADNAEKVEDSQEVLQGTENLQEHQDCNQTTSQDVETTPQPEPVEAEQLELTEEPAEIQEEEQHSEDQLGEHLEQPQQEMTEESTPTENAELPEEVTQEAAEAEPGQEDKQAEITHQAEEKEEGGEDETVQTVVANGVLPIPTEAAAPRRIKPVVDREAARHLAERLFNLDGIQPVEVVRHLDKDNDFSRAAGEEYLKFFDFTGQTLDQALRSFLKVVVLIGETQERERVLQHFACRFHQCNPDSFSSSGAVLALTCALMLLNTDLHGQNIGKAMSSSKFVCNLDGMDEGENFSKDLLKSLYNSIKSEPLEWAVDEEELKSSVLSEEDAGEDAPLRSKANPFQDVPHNKTATVVKQAFLQRKLHADIDGKRTPWGKRGWKTFYGVLRGMVLYLQKDDYRRDQMINEEVVSVHHSLAEPAADYTKKPHVFRLQTADWRVFLFQASSKAEMNSWISRINLVSALHSSPPFPAAVGSQRRFCRPILPASQSADTLESQLQSHAKMLESFKADLLYLQQNLPEGKKAKAKELEEHRVRAEYLQHEMCRYEIYIQVLEAWKSVRKTDDSTLTVTDLNLFDKAVCADSVGEGEEEEEGSLKKSHSSPSLELEMPTPTVIKVRRNISERRTYRRTIIPRWNKEA
uniref:PH and SEC7 domain-containing protein 2 n=1 Tax=Semicossyphus pulcher TaxID=241346 RepID=UPI0037E763C8